MFRKWILCSVVFLVSLTNAQLDQKNYLLEPQYTLGRIVGSAPLSNNTSFVDDKDVTLLMNDFNSLLGIDDRYSVGYTFNTGVIIGSNGALLLQIPEIDLTIAPTQSSRLHIGILTYNLALIFSSKNISNGLANPFKTQHHYQYEFLSRQGEISVDPDQFENAFYFKPLLNPGQFYLSAEVDHPLGELNHETYGALKPYFAIGLLDNMQVSFVGNMGTYRMDNSYERTTFDLQGQALYRYENYGFGGLYLYSNDDESKSGGFQLTSTQIFGKSVESFDEVKGNYDSEYSSLVGKNQFVNKLNVGIHNSFEGTDNWSFENDASYGISDLVTLRERFGMSPSNKSMLLRVGATFSNIPRRELGPSEVSRFEYLFGAYPAAGQWTGALDTRLPFGKRYFSNNNMMYTNTLDHFSEEIFLQSMGLNFRNGSNPSGSNDVSVSFKAGITESLIFESWAEMSYDSFDAAKVGFAHFFSPNNLLFLQLIFLRSYFNEEQTVFHLGWQRDI